MLLRNLLKRGILGYKVFLGCTVANIFDVCADGNWYEDIGEVNI
jgi:hypothetical protein